MTAQVRVCVVVVGMEGEPEQGEGMHADCPGRVFAGLRPPPCTAWPAPSSASAAWAGYCHRHPNPRAASCRRSRCDRGPQGRGRHDAASPLQAQSLGGSGGGPGSGVLVAAAPHQPGAGAQPAGPYAVEKPRSQLQLQRL